MITDGTLDGTNDFEGGLTLTGKVVPQDRLPFNL